MPLKFLVRLGLWFEDPEMEKENQNFKTQIQSTIFLAFSLFCSASTIGQVIVNYAFGPYYVILDFVIAGGAILALLVRNKIKWFYRLYFMLYIPLNTYTTIRNTVIRETPQPAGISCIVGNYLGVIEVLFYMIFRQASVQIVLACVIFAAKLVALGDELSLNENILWTGIIFVGVILMALYNEVLERRSFRMIYESKQTLEKFQALLSNDLPSNVAIVDSNFTTILYSNQAFSQKFGSERLYDKTKLISFVFTQFQIESLVKPSSYQHLISKGNNLLEFARKLSSCSPQPQSDEVIVLSATYDINQENLRHFEIRLRKILWEGKSCYTVILNDFSDKQLVTALKYADEQKDKVIATVSHELRTPINGILGLLEMAEPQVADATAQAYLQHCKSCSKLLLYLVNSILDLSQIRHNKLHIVKNMFNINELLEEMKSLYQFQCQQKGVELIIKKGSFVPESIYNDKYRVIEILINLLSNAFKFTFKGSIILSVTKDTENPTKIKFSVQDTGLGIKEEDKPKLFQMFGKITQENKNVNSHGAGLGLTISNSLVQALNDQDKEALELDSEYQKGSVFSFRIPFKKPFRTFFLATPSREDRSQSSSGLEEDMDLQEFSGDEGPISIKMETLTNRALLSTRSEVRFTNMGQNRLRDLPNIVSPSLPRNLSGKVLVVDDNPFNLLTASFLLEKQGLVVEKATSGEHCISLLQKTFEERDHFDLILMDIQMPIQDGIETTKIIVSKVKAGELYDVPIIALTANKVTSQELNLYRESGMKEALEKPLREDILNKILTTYVDLIEERETLEMVH